MLHIVTLAGYTIAGPEPEQALAAHDDGIRNEELQEFVKQETTPYEHLGPTGIIDAVPRTEGGKIQRFGLRKMERARISGIP
ncbi:MAG TPA: hypothetical protein VK943_17835 [Arenibaculum sp.]|nr:hypothetical protein [Arenibaculum sp.]